jgi:hypothetical protein
MVVKINYRQSFARTVGYAFKSSKSPEVVAGNMSLSTPDGIINEFTTLADKNTRCKTPVAHLAFSLAEGESLKQPEWESFCRKVAADYGFDQYVAVKHGDTSCEHIHFIGNRIQLNGKAVSTSNDRYRMRELCHRAEKEFSLQSTPERSDLSRVSKNELEKASRLYREGKTRLPVPQRLAIAEQAKAFAFQSRSLEEFTGLCQKAGITVHWRKSQDGKLSGISFASGKARISGTNAKLPLKRLLTILHQNETRHPNHTPRRANPGMDRHSDQQGRRGSASPLGGQYRSNGESGPTDPHSAQRGIPATGRHPRPDGSTNHPGRNPATYSQQQKRQVIHTVKGTLVNAANALTGFLEELDEDSVSFPLRSFRKPLLPKIPKIL